MMILLAISMMTLLVMAVSGAVATRAPSSLVSVPVTHFPTRRGRTGYGR
ncbi:hypothetical protein [Skermania sp. ID1734]|nr:hypothetical protein [Skermania sp. ID1734]